MKMKLATAMGPLHIEYKIPVEVFPMTAHDVARYFVSLVDEEAGDSISNLKVQKLLYYAQGFHLAMYEKPLFPDKIKAWMYGPVVPQVYHLYRDHGSDPITVEKVDLEKYPEETRELLDEVYSVYGQFTASKLRNMTHQEPPWRDTPQPEEISQEKMKKFFKTLVIEDDVPEAAANQR